MRDKIYLELSDLEVMNIINALQFFRDNAVKPRFKKIIDTNIIYIKEQLKDQGIDLGTSDGHPLFNFGEIINFDDQPAVIVGMADEDGFVKIAIVENNSLKTIEVPIVLIHKVE